MRVASCREPMDEWTVANSRRLSSVPTITGVRGNGEYWDPMGFPWEWE